MYSDTLILVAALAAYLSWFLSSLYYKKRYVSTNDVLFFPDERMPCWSFYNELNEKTTKCRQVTCQYAHPKDMETSFMRVLRVLNSATKGIDLCMYEFTEFKLMDMMIRKHEQGVKLRIITNNHLELKRPSEGAVFTDPDVSLAGNDAVHIDVGDSGNRRTRAQSKDCQHNKANSNKSKVLKAHESRKETANLETSAHQALGRPKANTEPVELHRAPRMNDQIPSLQDKGIPIRVNCCNVSNGTPSQMQPKMHNKFVIVDDTWVLMGSFNWTHGAIIRNDEALLVTNNSDIVAAFRRKFNKMWVEFQDRPRNV